MTDLLRLMLGGPLPLKWACRIHDRGGKFFTAYMNASLSSVDGTDSISALFSGEIRITVANSTDRLLISAIHFARPFVQFA
jgi:hypothetical protein